MSGAERQLLAGCVQVWHDCLTPRNSNLIQRIHSLEPTSMSWSNMCDTTPVPEFHRMAHACSAASTKHFLDSRGWVHDIKGAQIVHYTIPNPGLNPIDQGAEMLQQRMAIRVSAELVCFVPAYHRFRWIAESAHCTCWLSELPKLPAR